MSLAGDKVTFDVKGTKLRVYAGDSTSDPCEGVIELSESRDVESPPSIESFSSSFSLRLLQSTIPKATPLYPMITLDLFQDNPLRFSLRTEFGKKKAISLCIYISCLENFDKQ